MTRVALVLTAVWCLVVAGQASANAVELVWQIGVADNSFDEFGTTPMQREPIFYTVPLNWADYIDTPGDFWRDFPYHLNPPEDWPIMPQTVHIDFDLAAPMAMSTLHVWACYNDVDQGERLRAEIDGILVDDVRITNTWPAVDYPFSFGPLASGNHRISLTNTGGGGTAFDYLQLTPEPMTLCLLALGGVVALRRQKHRP